MSILIVRPTASGGLAAHVDHEISLLRAAGHEVLVPSLDIRSRPSPRADRATVRTLREILDREQPAAVHAHGLRAGALAALAVCRHRRLVVTLHNRTVGPLPVRAVGAALLRVLVRRADIVLAVSPDLAEAARSAGARHVVHALIPAPPAPSPEGKEQTPAPTAGHDQEHEQEKLGMSGAHASTADTPPLQVLVVARLAPQKGLDDLLDALALLSPAQRSAIAVSVAGDGPQREHLRQRIEHEQLPVSLLGWRSDVLALLAAADLVVSAARWEGQPVWIQEALRAGCALVVTDAGGTRCVTGSAATLVPVASPRELATAIRDHRDPARRAAARRAALARAAELPTEDDLRAQLEDVLLGPGQRW